MENDYIRREAAKEKLELLRDKCGNEEMAFALNWARNLLNDIPAANVAPVVRCKDCAYFHNGFDEKCCVNHIGVVITDENGFCHHAKKRDDAKRRDD